MTLKCIVVNDDGFCQNCPFQNERSNPPARSVCLTCKLTEKNSRVIFPEFGMVRHFDTTYILGCDSSGFMSYELPHDLRVLGVEK